MSRAWRVVAVLLVVTAHAMVLPTGHAWGATDPLRSQQWALTQIGAPDAWATATGRGVRIGVIDTGVDRNHEDLAGRIVDSTSCMGSGGDPERCTGDGQDDFGHGTHVSAIAAAVADNGMGIAGVAPDAQLLVVRALAKDGEGAAGKAADIVAGVRWVVDRGAKVVNLSLGTDPAGSDSPTLLAEGLAYAWSHGAVPVLAAGNGGRSGTAPDYGGLDALVVGASDREGRVTSYSSSLDRAKWGLIAPGGSGSDTARDASSDSIVSAWWDPRRPNRYAAGAGTFGARRQVLGASEPGALRSDATAESRANT